MSCVHYKFKSANTVYETITFDGMHISVADLKKAIIQQTKMGKLMESFNLQITKSQSGEVYEDSDLIPKNSSVIVARIPVDRSNTKSRAWESSRVDMSTALYMQKAEANTPEKLRKTSDLTNMKGSEEDKIKAIMQQTGKEYSQTNYVRPRYPTGPPPRNYVCHRCGQPGHFINACPNRDDGEMLPRMKRSTGIPNSFMTPVVDPHAPGVLMTNTGQLAVPTIDALAYMQGKKEKPPFVKSDSPERKQEERIIPGELLCPLCKDLLTDAVVAPCCGNSSCDECIRDALLDSDEHICPLCKESGISPDGLIPNKFMRTAVNNFQNETGYSTIKRRNQQEAEHVPAPAVTTSVPKPEPERQKILPPHLVGMPPQVIKAAQLEMASRGAHTTPSVPIGQHHMDTGSSVAPMQPMPTDLSHIHTGVEMTRPPGSGSVASAHAPRFPPSHGQPYVTGPGAAGSHVASSLFQTSQGNPTDFRPTAPGSFLDEHGVIHHAAPMGHGGIDTMGQSVRVFRATSVGRHQRPRLVHATGRTWPPNATTRGGVLATGRGIQRMMVFRQSAIGARRLGPPPSSGERRFPSPSPALDHRFTPPAAAGSFPPNQIPGHTPPQGMPGRGPLQQTPPGLNQGAPVIRIPAPLHSSVPPPQQIVFNRGPPPTAVPHLMPPEMLVTPTPAFIPPLLPQPGVNLQPPVPLTEEEFYREKERLLELERKKKSQESTESTVSRRKADPLDDFEELLQKKNQTKAQPAYRSHSRSRTRSRTRSFSKSKTRSRSRSLIKRTRNRTHTRSRSPVKTPVRRSRSITRSRTKSRSRSRPFLRSKSRSVSRYTARKKSFTPKRSLTPPRKYSRTRSRSPLPRRPRSRTYSNSPRPRSRSRSKSPPPRPSRRLSRSPSRSITRSPLPKKRPPRSRSPASRGRTPPEPKRHVRKTPSPRGRSRDRSHGTSQMHRRTGVSGASRGSPERNRSGYPSPPPRYDERHYYRYQEKCDPQWAEYYRMWQEWYDKYGQFAQGFPGAYEHSMRTHSRGFPRSRTRSRSPRPGKRSRSPEDRSRWRREKSREMKRPRIDVKERSRVGRGERDEPRRSSDRTKDKDRRKEIRVIGSKSDQKEKSSAVVGSEVERLQRPMTKVERRRDDERSGRDQSRDREESRQRNRMDVRDQDREESRQRSRMDARDEEREESRQRNRMDAREEREEERQRSRMDARDDDREESRQRNRVDARDDDREESRQRNRMDTRDEEREDSRQQNRMDVRDEDREGSRQRSKMDTRDDEDDNLVDRGRRTTSKSTWDKDNPESKEETSSIPVIGAGAGIVRQLSGHQGAFDIGERADSRESEKLNRDAQFDEDERAAHERKGSSTAERTSKQEHFTESKRIDKDIQHPKSVKPDSTNIKTEQRARLPEAETSKNDRTVFKDAEPDFNSSAMTTKAPSREKESYGSDKESTKSLPRATDRDMAPVNEKMIKKTDRLVPKDKHSSKEGNSSREHSDRQEGKKKPSSSPDDSHLANAPRASKWEVNHSDSDAEVPLPRRKEKERDKSTGLPKSVLESAENAIRHRSRPSVVSAVCSPPPPRSSIHRIGNDSKSPQSVKKSEKEQKSQRDEKRREETSGHSRRVIQGPNSLSMKVTVSSGSREKMKHNENIMEKESSGAEKRIRASSPGAVQDTRRSSNSDSHKVREKTRNESSSRHEEEMKSSKKTERSKESSKAASVTSSAAKDDVPKRGGNIRDRKASVFMDEDKFEPDYNESGSSDYEVSGPVERSHHTSRSESQRHESSSESEDVKAKHKKRHKKHKKQKKHKAKSRKDDQ